MAKVHARSLAEKIPITMNEDHQPVSDNQKIITELTNFVGSLARDNVSLTYVNWHVVPNKLKKELWEYTRVYYSNEGQKWVYSTLNDAWRGYKSPMKTKHYSNLPNDDERRAKRPDDIPLEDLKHF
ncbi:hypothetical protein DCAR_0933754 [Daucus carota subsp. sativus]|uniref:Uncharacterized protein n=1 Tax=Daucus carota subsp. sativus TaxID=79200 RepID=A0AAF0XVQ3_DAUCS|nr:hypothetical protein DCAR_0933754 [Daucus carota subsp. sativus]